MILQRNNEGLVAKRLSACKQKGRHDNRVCPFCDLFAVLIMMLIYAVTYLLSSMVPSAVTEMVLLPDSKFWLGTEASAISAFILIPRYMGTG